MSTYSFSIESMIRGYHVYKDIWNDSDDKVLECKHEPVNSSDPYASNSLSNSSEVFGTGLKYFSIDIFNTKTADYSHMRTKIGKSNFSEFMVIRRIRQSFPPPMFPYIQYSLILVFFGCK